MKIKNLGVAVVCVVVFFGSLAEAKAPKVFKKAGDVIKKLKPKPKVARTPLLPGPYFYPTHTLPGIGLDRQEMTDEILQVRTKQLIATHTFSILSDPRAMELWPKRMLDPKLQAIISSAAQDNDFPKNVLEALIFVESGGDPSIQSPTGPKGIMQITEGTAKQMGLKKYKVTRFRLVPQRKLVKKAAKGQPAIYQDLPPKLKAYKEEIDPRLIPEKAIPAAAKFLAKLTAKYGRVDFAVWAYHSGEGYPNRALVLAKKYGLANPTMAKLFFGYSPAWRQDLFKLMDKDMDHDYGPAYYFSVTRAMELLTLYRKDPKEYNALAKQYVNPINPENRTPNRLWLWYLPENMYKTALDLREASGQKLVRVPSNPQMFSYALRLEGEEAIGEKDRANRELYLQDPPEVIGALLYVTSETRRLWDASHPAGEKFLAIDVTSLVRSVQYQALLKKNPNSHTGFPTHCIGAADLSYLNLPEWETACLRFVVRDLGWDEYLSYFWESRARKTTHIAPSPKHAKFFISVYNEALAYILAHKH